MKKKKKNKKFKAGQAVVYEPSWWDKYPQYHKKHPLKKGKVVHFLAYHAPAIGHCIVTTYEGKVITMLHPEDFREATDDEV